MDDMRTGRCLCGAAKFTVQVPEASFAICHCSACRRWSGGPLMSVHCPGKAVLEDPSSLTWFRSSPWAERGFCRCCGSSLFWRLADDPDSMVVVTVDSLDEAGDIALKRHIYVDFMPDRYEFADDKPRITEAQLMEELGLDPPSDP